MAELNKLDAGMQEILKVSFARGVIWERDSGVRKTAGFLTPYGKENMANILKRCTTVDAKLKHLKQRIKQSDDGNIFLTVMERENIFEEIEILETEYEDSMRVIKTFSGKILMEQEITKEPMTILQMTRIPVNLPSFEERKPFEQD